MSADCVIQTAEPPASTTAAVCSSSEQLMLGPADYATATGYYQPQAAAPAMAFAYSATSEAGMHGGYQQQPMPQPFYPPELMQPQCVYFYPPHPMCAPPGPDQLAAAAAVYGQGVQAPTAYATFYQPAAAAAFPPPPPPPQHQQQQHQVLQPISQPPPLMQQQPLMMGPPLQSVAAMPVSSAAGSCPCCSVALHPQSQQPQIHLPQHHLQQQQPPPHQQLLREQSRSSSCDSAYRTVSTSDLASVADVNQQRPTPQQLLAPPPAQPWAARRNSSQLLPMPTPQQQQHQQQQQQQHAQFQKRWKTGYLRNILYKTEMCRDVAQRGACPRGATCQFAHSDAELLSPSQHPLYKTAFCFDYKNRGHCQRGDHCFHAHQPSELRPAPPGEMQTPPSSSASSQQRPLQQQQQQQQLQQRLSGSGARRESTPRSVTASGPFKSLAARLQQQHQLLQQTSGSCSDRERPSSSSSASLMSAGKLQQQFSAERQLSLTGAPRSGF